METNWNQLIERYLNGELSAEGKAGFETELAKNPELKQEFELHKLTQEVIKRSSTRNMVQQSAKSYHFKKTLTNTGIVLLIAAVITTAIVLFTNSRSNSEKPNPEAEELIEQSLLEEMNKDLQFENIDPQYFKFTGENDVFLSESGVLLSITNESFLLNGKPYKGEAVVQWQEAQKASEIIKAGLSTLSGNKLLETQGMFSLNAFTPDGKQLDLSKKGIYVQVPVDELKKDMMLFNGVKGKSGNIDWQNPVELERLPKPKSMAKMDLFPPKYEPKLNELKWFTNKAKRDSLYLSFEESLVKDTISSIEQIDLFNDIPQPLKQPGISNGKSVDLGGLSQISLVVFPKIQDSIFRAGLIGTAQTERAKDKVKWDIRLEKITGTNEAWITARVSILKDWSINAIAMPKESFGVPTAITFAKSANYELIGKIIEPAPKNRYDEEADEHLTYHEGNVVFRQKIGIKSNTPSNISVSYTYQTSKTNSHCLPPEVGYSLIYLNGGESKTHIPPSKVLAIWNKKFDNTILATQDFEDRMKAIHNTCDERIFDVYANNLNEPLWKLDERVVKMGYPEFRKFADQKVGSVKITDKHQQNLQRFYDETVKTIQSKGKDALMKALKKDEDWDRTMQNERNNEAYRKGSREVLNKSEESDFNLKHLSKQLGTTLGFNLSSATFSATNSVSGQKPNSGSASGFTSSRQKKYNLPIVVNIDRLTPELLSAKESMTVNMMDKSKSAQLVYTPFNVHVASSKNYDRLYFYLMPTEQNSFERLDFTSGILNTKLNEEMNYKGAIVGMNEKGYFLYPINAVKPGNLGTIQLVEVSEKEFNKQVDALNAGRNSNPMDIQSELNWLFKEKANYKVQKQRKKDAEFRAVVRTTIYSCGSQDIAVREIPQPAQADTKNVSASAPFSAITDVVGDPASYPGGRTALLEFLKLNIKYPQRAMEEGFSGKVYLKFIVSETGKISNVIVNKKLPGCPECDAEAKRVVEMMPDWVPAKNNNTNVSSYFNLPISFSLK